MCLFVHSVRRLIIFLRIAEQVQTILLPQGFLDKFTASSRLKIASECFKGCSRSAIVIIYVAAVKNNNTHASIHFIYHEVIYLCRGCLVYHHYK